MFSVDVIKIWRPFFMKNLETGSQNNFLTKIELCLSAQRHILKLLSFQRKLLSQETAFCDGRKKRHQESYNQLWVSAYFSSTVLQLHLVAIIWLHYYLLAGLVSPILSPHLAAMPPTKLVCHRHKGTGVPSSYIKIPEFLAVIFVSLFNCGTKLRLAIKCFVNMGSSPFSLLQALDWLSWPTHRLSHSCLCPHSGPSSSSPCWWCWVWTVRWDNSGTKWRKIQKSGTIVLSPSALGTVLSRGVFYSLMVWGLCFPAAFGALLLMPTTMWPWAELQLLGLVHGLAGIDPGRRIYALEQAVPGYPHCFVILSGGKVLQDTWGGRS